ncbi:hypothetical protein Lbir_1633 [Legionella birminghamensis]|uniref:Uncharacterized protein involved in ubiquinone biosynthesis n=1 Tax=Legionella birminghamensis TaxID=28083 RepID=A0A378IDS3_9GAMM|nr:hypothetical protein [Legionella birminghamensis]KTC71580.1 hypothetical protein Lbir_1633 [Legionella birminghamensis]STX32885.1 Uncharacterized protein involved in ubiquinone biosynthesis [Legionella birminghamensis]
MRLLKPSAGQAKSGLRAFREIMLADPETKELTELQIRTLEAAQKFITNTHYFLDEISEPIEPDELAKDISEPALRQQLVEGMVVISTVNGTPKPEQIKILRRFADALKVDHSLVDALQKLAGEHRLLYALDVVRHMYIGEAISKAWRKEKFKGIYKIVGAMRGFYQDPGLAKQYHDLENLPDGTLGKEFWRFYTDHQFIFPGEKYGSPVMMTYHDMAHVLGGYDTTPVGELKVASFTAGFRNVGRPWILLFIISQFHLGVKTVPIDVPGMTGEFNPEEQFLALQRGSLMNVDLFDNWDYWPVMDQPIEQVRQSFNILPDEKVLEVVQK